MSSLTLRLIFEDISVLVVDFMPRVYTVFIYGRVGFGYVFLQSNVQRAPSFTDVIIFTLFTFDIIHNTTLFQLLSFVFHVSQLLPDGVKWPMVHVDSIFLFHRAEKIVTNEEDKKLEIEHCKNALRENGYAAEWMFKIPKKREKPPS